MPNRVLFMSVAIIVVTVAVSAHAAVQDVADDWVRFRGPNGHGVSSAKNIPTNFTIDDLNWHVTLPGGGISSPIIFGDAIYLTWINKDTHMRALGRLSTADGSIQWVYEDTFDSYEQHRDNSFASSTPTVDSHGVYCYWSSGDRQIVLAVSHTGEKLWEKTLGTFGADWGTGASPILADGVLIVTNDNEQQASFLAGLDPRTGKELWRRERTIGRSSYATPIVLGRDETSESSAVVFASTTHGLTCLAARDGSLLWEVDGVFKQRCVGSPVLAGGLVYQTTGTGGGGTEGIAVELPTAEQDRAADDTIQPQARVHHEIRGGLPYVPTPVAYKDWLFLWSDGGIVSCLNAADGQLVWKQRVGGRYYGSPICIDGAIYCMSRDGDLVIIAAADEYNELCRVDLGEGSSATPAVAGGVLYLRTENQLMAIGGDDPA